MTTEDRFTTTLWPHAQREIVGRHPGRVVLQVSSGEARRTAEVDRARITIGAHDSNGLCIKDDAASNVHCELVLNEDGEDGAMLRDLGSKNGTWVDDFRIKEVWLPLGRSFCVGRTTITLTDVESVDVPIATVDHFGGLYGCGPQMGELFAILTRLATVELDALIVGETGTGKGLIARGLHDQSSRREGPFVVVDCTHLNKGTVESELFGHKRGSFTDATEDRPGLLEAADGGTVFFDEIGELSLALQPKLLRALEARETLRVGENTYRRFDARVIAATNCDLPRMVCQGKFRDDLYFRLSALTVRVPPLRGRGSGNIGMLADRFLDTFARERGTELRFDKAVYKLLSGFRWPGNVRQLRHVIRALSMMSANSLIRVSDIPPAELIDIDEPRSRDVDSSFAERLQKALTLPWNLARKEFGRIYAEMLLTDHAGNQTLAARSAGLSRNAFRALLKPTNEG